MDLAHRACERVDARKSAIDGRVYLLELARDQPRSRRGLVGEVLHLACSTANPAPAAPAWAASILALSDRSSGWFAAISVITPRTLFISVAAGGRAGSPSRRPPRRWSRPRLRCPGGPRVAGDFADRRAHLFGGRRHSRHICADVFGGLGGNRDLCGGLDGDPDKLFAQRIGPRPRSMPTPAARAERVEELDQRSGPQELAPRNQLLPGGGLLAG